MNNDIINFHDYEPEDSAPESEIVAVSETMLAEVRASISENKAMSVPIAQLATLGAGVASLAPFLRTVTQSSQISAPGGIYRLLNDTGDGLKQARNGLFWGATKGSKMGRFEKVDAVSSTQSITMPIDPMTMMMAVALASIEKKLDDIAEVQRQILSFLEIEKESEIEGDVETLVRIINNYKYNWDNTQYIASNHKMVLDIQRTARKNMISYRKAVADILKSNQLIVAQNLVKSTLNDLLKKFKYYRLSLYSYAMASFIEIMLSKNFKEEYIREIKEEIEEQSYKYREHYDQCSKYLEKLTTSSVETNVMKGLGAASKAIGGFLGGISFMKGSVDTFLNGRGESLNKNAGEIESETIERFAEVKAPNTKVFIDKMEDVIQIYNHTEVILFDQSMIYLMKA